MNQYKWAECLFLEPEYSLWNYNIPFTVSVSEREAPKKWSRPETGPMEFEDDWRGIFIRGDNALMGYLPMLLQIQEKITVPKDKETFGDLFLLSQLNSLIHLFESAGQTQDYTGVQLMKPFNECVQE